MALLVNIPPAWATKDFYIKNNSQTYLYVNGTSGNVGIGSLTPGQILDVQGTVRTTAFTMSGQTPISGYVLTASDSAGDTTWTSAGAVSGWTISGNNVYETLSGNVGIGTTLLTTSALTVMNGNVGIGTWKPGNSLEIVGGNIGIGTAYNLVGIGTTSTILTMQTDTTSIYLGWQAGASSTAGALNNTAVGNQVLNLNTSGSGNSAVGIGVLKKNSTGSFNSVIGNSALVVNTTGSRNVAMGGNALSSNTTGSFNSAVGFDALFNNSAGNNNIAVGNQAGWPGGTGGTVNGAYNVFLGPNSGPSGTSDWNESVGIGSFAVTGANNVMVLGGMGSNAVNVGIGTYTPVNTLSVSGNAAIGSNSAYTSTSAPNNGLIVQSNTGIGTFSPQAQLAVLGNVGIGTWTAAGGNLIVNGGGNVGISSVTPGQSLDVQGSVRMLGFTLTGNGAAPGSVLVTNNIGLGSWMPVNTIANAGFINQQTANQIPYYNSPNPSTTLIGSTNFVFNIPNVGIGTTTPLATLQVVGNIGISTLANGDNFVLTSPPKGGIIVEGNVGIATYAPADTFQVGKNSSSSSGLEIDSNGNVGMGTTITSNASLSVMSGNVGIGTWVPGAALIVTGNVGIGTGTVPSYNLDLVNGTSRSRPVRRVNTITETTSSTVTVNSNTTDVEEVSGFNNAAGITLTFANPSPSNPNDEDLLEFRVLDGGTAITIAYGTNFASTTTTLPLTTVASTWLRILFEYNSTTTKWECVAST